MEYLHSAVGEPRRLTSSPGRCQEVITWPTRPLPCGVPATAWTAHPPGRSPESECLCAPHGGDARALELLSRSWPVLAPDVVGDDVAVMDAGAAGLSSLDVYVAVRPHGARWVAALGIGGHTRQLRGSYPTADAAEAVGVAAWRRQVSRDVEEITAARGGTLGWGMPVRPIDNPIVLRCRAGQSAYAALRERELTALLGPPSERSASLLVWRRGDVEIALDGRDLAYLRNAGSTDLRSARNISMMSAKDQAAELLRAEQMGGSIA